MTRALIYPAQRRIGCVLLQALAQCDYSVPHLFDTKNWQMSPAEGGVVVTGTKGEWRDLAKRWNEQA